MEILSDSPRAALLSYKDAAAYCGLDTRYLNNLHKEGIGPSYLKPSARRVYFTRDALEKWMATWQVVSR